MLQWLVMSDQKFSGEREVVRLMGCITMTKRKGLTLGRGLVLIALIMVKNGDHVIGTQFPEGTRVKVVQGDEHLTLWNKAIEFLDKTGKGEQLARTDNNGEEVEWK